MRYRVRLPRSTTWTVWPVMSVTFTTAVELAETEWPAETSATFVPATVVDDGSAVSVEKDEAPIDAAIAGVTVLQTTKTTLSNTSIVLTDRRKRVPTDRSEDRHAEQLFIFVRVGYQITS
ncbi:hypothetical protein BG842_20580 [Haladaptatus sp. W1]|uniref:hypothetical protein n=1 Tax=Haladaptatus sp. W1 TaxID=1897478 RepID=UPI000849DC17|nr:hypothetical protein [Haladaptatus sp. W1]ODR81688.1 hypothetical protein BG842_20580 [Haladaptatus sp. W1]